MKGFFSENKTMIIVIGIIVAALPILISIAMFFPIFGSAKGDADSWLSFWGSYLGGIFSGVMTFLGVFMAFKLERENNKKNQARRNYSKTFELFEWTNDLLKYLKNGNSSLSTSLYEKGVHVLDGLAEVDTEWYLEAKYIQTEVFQIYMNQFGTIENKKNDIEKLHRDVMKYIGKN